MVKKLIVTVCIEAAILAVGAMISPTFIAENAVWIALGAMAVLTLVAIYEWLTSRRPQGDGGTTVQTRGLHSPIISGGTFNAPVTFGPPSPPALQERRQASARHYDIDKVTRGLQGALRGLRAQTDSRSSYRGRVERLLADQAKRCPEMPIWEAIHSIASRIGDTNEAEDFPEARRQLRQSAVEGRIDIWGQEDIPPQHMKDERHKEIWRIIEPDYWHDFALHFRAAREAEQEAAHTYEEELPGRRGNRYWNLKVRPYEVDRRWPKPLRTTNDGKP